MKVLDAGVTETERVGHPPIHLVISQPRAYSESSEENARDSSEGLAVEQFLILLEEAMRAG